LYNLGLNGAFKLARNVLLPQWLGRKFW
jgi:hypothetical protein